MYGYYYCGNKADFWLPHPAGVNVLFIDRHVKLMHTEVGELQADLASYGTSSPTMVVNKLIGVWGDTAP
jgi:hypothetical protein